MTGDDEEIRTPPKPTRRIFLVPEERLAQAEAERDAALAQVAALRQNWAKSLTDAYRRNPVEIARLCDEQYDRSGALLGYVREAALDNPGETP